jgi:hypothetical protein
LTVSVRLLEVLVAVRVPVLLLALLLSACGTTVPMSATVAGAPGAGDQGLGGAGTTGSTGGLATSPGSTGTSGGLGGPSQAGGTGGTSGTSGTTGTTGAVAGGTATGGTSGGARNTAPIKIGIVLTGTSNADSFGISLGNTISERDVDQALVDGLNAQGGLNGRKIVPVFANTDTGSPNWETDFSAACATFTQDNRVEAVLGYVFNYFASFESCLARKGIPHLSTGFNIPDTKELSAFPLHVALDVPTIGRRTLLKLDGGVRDGVLTSKNKIGTLRDTCPGTARSYDQVLLPTAKRLGLSVVKDVQISCPNGNSDAGAAVQAVQSAVLQFASAGVDRVFFHASSEGPALLLFALSAESQGYRPGYIVSSLANLESLRGNFPADAKPRIHGYGWMPTQDARPADYSAKNASQKRCLSLIRSKGVVPTSGPDYYYAYNICEAFFVYELAMRGAGTTQGSPLVVALKRLGSSFASTTNQGGSSFSSSLPDAPRSARHVVYTPSCDCYRYTGPDRLIPTS